MKKRRHHHKNPKKNPIDSTTLILILGLAGIGVYLYMQSQNKVTDEQKKQVAVTLPPGLKQDAQGNVVNEAGKIVATAKQAVQVVQAAVDIGQDLYKMWQDYKASSASTPSSGTSSAGTPSDPSSNIAGMFGHGTYGMAQDAAMLPRPYGYASYHTVGRVIGNMYGLEEQNDGNGKL